MLFKMFHTIRSCADNVNKGTAAVIKTCDWWCCRISTCLFNQNVGGVCNVDSETAQAPSIENFEGYAENISNIRLLKALAKALRVL